MFVIFVEDIPLYYRFEKQKIYLLQSNTTIFYYLTYWPQFSVIRPSSGHLYIKFKTGHL